jgi:hypothetical protein
MEWIDVDRREALRTAALFALLLIAAFFNVVFQGESLIPGNNFNPFSSACTKENYGPHVHSAQYFKLRGVVPYSNIHDAGSSWWQGEPAMELLKRAVRRGEFPLWDPYIGGGVPSMANLTPAYFFPPSFLIALLGNPPWLKNLYTLLLLLGCGFFTYVFIRKHNAGVIGSRVAGIAFMFSGAAIQTAPEFIGQPVVGIPIVLFVTARLLQRPTWRRTAVTALVYALVALASFPPVLVFAFSLAVLYVIAMIVFAGAEGGRGVLAARFGAAVALSLALVAFYYIPVAYVIRDADDVRLFYQDAGMGTLGRRAIFQLLSPALVVGTPSYYDPIVYSGAHGNLFYFGISGLILAAATFARIRPAPLLLLLQITAALLLLKLFGVPPFQYLGKLPILNATHISIYGGILLGFLLACLAGIAVDLLLQRRLALYSVIGSIAGIAVMLLALYRIAWREGRHIPQYWRWAADFRVAVLFFAVAAILLLTAHKFKYAGIAILALVAAEGVTNASFPRQPAWNYWEHPPRYVRALAAHPSLGRVLPLGLLPANINSPHSIGSTDSLFTFNSSRYAELHHRYLGSPDYILLRSSSNIPSDSVLDAFAIDRILILSRLKWLIKAAADRGYPLIYRDAEAMLFARPSAPRYFLTRDYAIRQRADAFYELATQPPQRVLVETRPGFAPDPQMPAGATVQVERFGLNSYQLRVNSPVPALLSASETYSDGWTAIVNGKPAPILRANYAFRAIEVPAGQSRVEFHYWPPGMTIGIIISAIALLIAVGVSVSRSRLLTVAALLLCAASALGQAPADEGFKGQGAALCVAAGEVLAAQPRPEASIREGVLAWRQVLHVMDGTDAQRQAALEQARASLAATNDADARRAARLAQVTWSVACARREMQIKYIAVHGSKDRTLNNLAEEPGNPLGAEAASLLNVRALCMAGAEFFLQPKPSPALRAAFQNATPRIPSVAILRSMQGETRKKIDDNPGSIIGKALVVDYYRFLYASASNGAAPQSFVDQASVRLKEHCLPAGETGK